MLHVCRNWPAYWDKRPPPETVPIPESSFFRWPECQRMSVGWFLSAVEANEEFCSDENTH